MNPAASILTVGSELLKGSVLNTNSRFLAQTFANAGFETKIQISCGDSIAEIESCLSHALSQSDVIVLTGGLGPTPDDVTRDALSHFFKVPLILSNKQLSSVRKYYRKNGRKVPKIVIKEAQYPENAKPLFNKHGIALGFYIPCGLKTIIVLPGVPLELERMVNESVLPLLEKIYGTLLKKPCLVVKMAGISEPDVMKRLHADFFDDPMDFGIYPEPGQVTLRLYAQTAAVIRRLKSKVQRRLSSWVYSYEDISFYEALGKKLLAKRKNFSAAESCTGGLLSSEICSVPGASRYFKGGVTAYHNQVKILFGVPQKVLSRHGAVSSHTAKALANTVRTRLDSDFGIGITGIAGPSGASRGKPVGTVYIAVSSSKKVLTRKFLFWGQRRQIQHKAVIKAVEMLWHFID